MLFIPKQAFPQLENLEADSFHDVAKIEALQERMTLQAVAVSALQTQVEQFSTTTALRLQ